MNLNNRQTINHLDFVQKTSIESILQPAVQFANSYGLKPFKIIVKEDDINDKQASRQNAYFIVIAIRSEFTRKHISAFIRNLTTVKHIPSNSLDSYRYEFESRLNDNNDSGKKWAAKQAYLALDIILASAKQNGADVKIAENLEPDQYDQALGLVENGWHALIALTISLNAGKTNPRKNLAKTINSTF
jgi:nitroreductase / dihydropteridine reductase